MKSNCFFILIIYVYLQVCFSSTELDKRMLIGEDQFTATQHQISQLEANVNQLLTDAAQQKSMLNTLADQLVQVAAGGCGGVMFTRWGKKTCPINSTQVYSGFAGGSGSGQSGGASNHLCMPRDPIAGNRPKPSTYGYVYGAEFETTFFGTFAQNEDVPCAVCIAPDVSLKMMIPGRNKCYHGWKELYHGYLAGNVYNGAGAGDYICMEENPDFIFGGKADTNGRQFYGVVTSCGSLRCPPYNESSPLTCVLCTQ